MEEPSKLSPPVPGSSQPPEDAPDLSLHLPVKVRSVALVVLAVLGALATLRWASAFFVPLMLGFMISYALAPIVDALQRLRIPRSISAAVLLVGLLGGVGSAVYGFSDDINQLIAMLPDAAAKVREAVRTHGRAETPLGTVQKAAAQLEQAAAEAGTPAPPARGVQRVVVEKPRFDIRDHLWTGTVGLISLIGQITLVTFLTFFLLLSGDTFRRKLVKITGPTFTEKRITVQALDEIHGQIQRYLLVQLVTSILVGVATGVAFWAVGLKHAGAWGFGAGVLNLIPYVGSAVITGAAALASFLQFGEIKFVLAVAGASLVIHAIVGNLLVPWLTSRASRMNPVVVFVGVLAWGWLWGVWGLLLGMPILLVIKAVCDRVEHLKPVGELLGE